MANTVSEIVAAAEAAGIADDKTAMATFVLGYMASKGEPAQCPRSRGCRGTAQVLEEEMAKDAANNKIHLVDLKANYKTMRAEIDQQVAEVMGSCWFIGGPKVSAFEKSFAEFIGTKHCVACNSGTVRQAPRGARPVALPRQADGTLRSRSRSRSRPLPCPLREMLTPPPTTMLPLG